MMGKVFTWYPEYCDWIECSLAKMCLREGLPGSPETFVMPDYWEEDNALKSLESRLLKALTLVEEEEEGMQEAKKE